MSTTRDGALANERDRHRMGAHAVARAGMGGTEEGAEALRSRRDPIPTPRAPR